MFGVSLVKLRADRQPKINKDEHAPENVQTMQTRDCEITREVRAVRRQKHRRAFHIGFLDRSDLLGRWRIKEMRTIERGIGGIGVHWIERDLVFLDVRII